MSKPLTFYSNGKLLLTGEYVVLDGAKALALPTKLGQNLTVEKNNSNTILWKSYDEKGNIWFEHEFDIALFKAVTKQKIDDPVIRLRQIINAAKKLNPDFLKTNQGYDITTHLEFNRHWGLGTSSTLINNIANWAQVDPYALLHDTFKGSGYDIACANAARAIIYNLANNYQPIIESVDFNPSFKAHLHFVYLNKKQNSREGMSSYTQNTYNKDTSILVDAITKITRQILNCETLLEFNSLIDQHERLIAEVLKQEPVKSKLFSDFKGSIKSLGAWGGDFVLATGSQAYCTSYFKNKGYSTILPYTELIK